MPSRITSPTGYYHIMCRGNNKHHIFKKPSDRLQVIDTLQLLADSKEIEIYAYCIMSNHFHILAYGEPVANLSHAMHRLNTSFSQYYKVKYNYVGHVFQGRFKSKCIVENRYFLTVLRYVHQNPVVAGYVPNASKYEFSSFQEYLGVSKRKIISDNAITRLANDKIKSVDNFIKFHTAQNMEEMVVHDKIFDSNKPIEAYERECALSDKKKWACYSDFCSSDKLHFAEMLHDKYKLLSIRCIASIAEIDRRKLYEIIEP